MIGEEEKQAIIRLFPFMGENPIVFDVGSNKGDFSDIILQEFGDKCRLHLFEPNEKLLSFTEIKYEYQTNITFHKNGLWKEEGRLPFFYFENYNNELSSFYKGGESWDGLPIKENMVFANTIDWFINSSLGIDKVDYIKIDCEGADIDVLLGCEKSLSGNKIGIIQIEYSKHWERGGHSWSEFKSIVEKYKYKIYRYFENNFVESQEPNGYDNYFITKCNIHNYSVGWNREFIYNTNKLMKMDMVLEVGAFEGLTTKYICENLLDIGGRVNVVDPLEDYYTSEDTEHIEMFIDQYKRFLSNTKGLYFNLYRGKSEIELPKLNVLRHDLCYVDGDHREYSVYFDLVWCFAITRIGGYIIADDYGWREETKNGVDKFLDEFSASYELIDKRYQVMIKKTKNQYNSLTYEYYK